MYHRKSTRKFGRETKQRKALLRSLAEALIINEKIKTTEAKAKSLRPYVEKLVTKSRTNTLTSNRLLIAQVNRQSVKKLLQEVGPRYLNRAGGYTRIRKLAPRSSDGARMAIIEFVK